MKKLTLLSLAFALALTSNATMAESIDAARDALIHAHQQKWLSLMKQKPSQLELRKQEQAQLKHDLQLHPHMGYDRMENHPLQKKTL